MGQVSKIKTIAKAWLEVYKGTTTDEHKRRSKICGACPSAKYNLMIDFIDDELVESKGMVCNECGCPILAKLRSTEICEKW